MNMPIGSDQWRGLEAGRGWTYFCSGTGRNSSPNFMTLAIGGSTFPSASFESGLFGATVPGPNQTATSSMFGTVADTATNLISGFIALILLTITSSVAPLSSARRWTSSMLWWSFSRQRGEEGMKTGLLPEDFHSIVPWRSAA